MRNLLVFSVSPGILSHLRLNKNYKMNKRNNQYYDTEVKTAFQEFVKYAESDKHMFDRDFLSSLHYELYRYRKAFHLMKTDTKLENMNYFGFCLGMCLVNLFEGKWQLNCDNSYLTVRIVRNEEEMLIDPRSEVLNFLLYKEGSRSIYDISRDLAA